MEQPDSRSFLWCRENVWPKLMLLYAALGDSIDMDCLDNWYRLLSIYPFGNKSLGNSNEFCGLVLAVFLCEFFQVHCSTPNTDSTNITLCNRQKQVKFYEICIDNHNYV